MKFRILARGLLCFFVTASTLAPVVANAEDEVGLPESDAVPLDSPPPEPFTTWQDLFTVQARLDRAVAILESAVELEGGFGFAGFILDVPNSSLTLYWKDGVGIPKDVASSVESLNDEPDIAVSIAGSAYSRAELIEELKRLLDATKDASYPLVGIKPLPLWAGLKIGISAEASPEDPVLQSTCHTEVYVAPYPTYYSRMNDFSPYYGGARVTPGYSTSFGIGHVWGDRWMVTAGHCGENNNAVDNGDGRPMGTMEDKKKIHDIIKIRVPSAGRYIYDGQANESLIGTGEFVKEVVGHSRAVIGTFLCTSGSFSGARCGAKVTDIDSYETFFDGLTPVLHGPLSQAEDVNDQSIAGSGDSGGPVFSLAPDTSKVIAKGMIQGGLQGTDFSRPCSGGNTSPTRVCSKNMFFVDIQTILGVYAAFLCKAN